MPRLARNLYHEEPYLQSLIGIIGRCAPAATGDMLARFTAAEAREVATACEQIDLAFTLPAEWAQLAPDTELDLRIMPEDWTVIASKLLAHACSLLEPFAAALQAASVGQRADWVPLMRQPDLFTRWRNEQELVAIASDIAVGYLSLRYPANAAERRPFRLVDRFVQGFEELDRHKIGFAIITTTGEQLVCRSSTWKREMQSGQAALLEHAKPLLALGLRLASVGVAADLAPLRMILEALRWPAGLAGVESALTVLQDLQQLEAGLQSPRAKSVIRTCLATLDEWTAVAPLDADARIVGADEDESEALVISGRTVHPMALNGFTNTNTTTTNTTNTTTTTTTTTTSTLPETPAMNELNATPDTALERPRKIRRIGEAGMQGGQRSPAGPTTIGHIGKNLRVVEGATLEPGAVIGDDVVLGGYARVCYGAQVGNGVKVPANVQIGPGAIVNAINLPGQLRFQPGTILGGNLTCSYRCTFPSPFITKGDCFFGKGVKVRSLLVFAPGARVFTLVGCEALPAGTTVGGSVYVKKGCAAGEELILGAEVKIEENVRIGSRVRIGDHVRVIHDTQIGDNASIDSNLKIVRHVPKDAVVTALETTVHGQPAIHCARPLTKFWIGPGGVMTHIEPIVPPVTFAGEDLARGQDATSTATATIDLTQDSSARRLPWAGWASLHSSEGAQGIGRLVNQESPVRPDVAVIATPDRTGPRLAARNPPRESSRSRPWTVEVNAGAAPPAPFASGAPAQFAPPHESDQLMLPPHPVHWQSLAPGWGHPPAELGAVTSVTTRQRIVVGNTPWRAAPDSAHGSRGTGAPGAMTGSMTGSITAAITGPVAPLLPR